MGVGITPALVSISLLCVCLCVGGGGWGDWKGKDYLFKVLCESEIIVFHCDQIKGEITMNVT